MAKQNNTLKFTNATIDLESNLIIEVTKDAEYAHSLMDTLRGLEGKSLDITFAEKNDVLPDDSFHGDE